MRFRLENFLLLCNFFVEAVRSVFLYFSAAMESRVHEKVLHKRTHLFRKSTHSPDSRMMR